MKKITDEEKDKIIDLYFNQSFIMTDIEKKLNISRPIISKVINEYKIKNDIDIKFSKININTLKTGRSINIPNTFLKKLDISDDDRDVKIVLNKTKKEIKIKKISK